METLSEREADPRPRSGELGIRLQQDGEVERRETMIPPPTGDKSEAAFVIFPPKSSCACIVTILSLLLGDFSCPLLEEQGQTRVGARYRSVFLALGSD